MKKTVSLALATLLFFITASLSDAQGRKEVLKVEDSTEVLQQIVSIPEKAIPPTMLNEAHGIAIIPGVIKAGFVVGGRYGSGVLMIRGRQGEWSNPVFITLTGGSIGWQIGVESIDIVLIFRTSRSVESILRGKFTLGADASIAAGPVGRTVGGATDVELKSEIFSYSRSRGLFAGLSLEGAALQIDHAANDSFYELRATHPREIVEGKELKTPTEAVKLKELLKTYSSRSDIKTD